MSHTFKTKTDAEDNYRRESTAPCETPARQQLDAQIAAYAEMGLSAQEAIADFKRQDNSADQRTLATQSPKSDISKEFRAFVETAGAVALTGSMMRLSGWLFMTLIASGPAYMRTVALWVMMACYFGMGYLLETLTPRRAATAILLMVGFFFGAYGLELALNGHLGIMTTSFVVTYGLMGAEAGLLGTRISRNRRKRRARHRLA